MTNYFKELQSHSSKYHWFWQLFQGDAYSSFHTKTWHSQVWCIMLPKVWHFFLLNLFWNPNLCFPRTDSRASLCHHTILLFKWNSLAFLRVQDNLAAAATGTQTYCTWAITPCDPARFSVSSGKPAQVQAETSSLTWKKPSGLNYQTADSSQDIKLKMPSEHHCTSFFSQQAEVEQLATKPAIR